METRTVKLSIQGRFSLMTSAGDDITPKAQKERALLALLAMSEGRSRSRAWVCDKLWSDRSQAQGLASLRRALCNIRKVAGDHADFIQGSRHELSLADSVELDLGPVQKTETVLLDDLVVRDPEFDDWLQRARGNTAPPKRDETETNQPARGEKLVDIRLVEVLEPSTSEETFVQSLLIDGMASRFSTLGNGLHITRHKINAVPEVTSPGTIELSIESIIADKGWRVNVRAISGNTRAFIWSGSMSIALNFEQICNGPRVGAFITQVISGIIARYQREPDRVANQFLQLQTASSRLFSGLRSDIIRGQQELNQLPTSGVSLAWRGFGKLTETIEFAESNADTIGESLQFAREAVGTSAENPMVLALAAQIHLKLSDDPEYGIYLADQAFQLCSHDPYVLLARSQARFFQSDAEASRIAAQWARECAATHPNSFWWDMQSALSEVGVGNLKAAKTLAKQTHLKMPSYRPALRYLVALSLLDQDPVATQNYASRLKAIETGFQVSDLFKPNYPVQTLRMTGLLKSMKPDQTV